MKSDTPGDEQPAPAEQVGQPAAEQQETAEQERVGGDHPLELTALKCRSVLIDGSATFTIATSRTTMN